MEFQVTSREFNRNSAKIREGECQQFCVSLISLINRWLVKILGKSFTVHHSHFFHGCCPSW